MSVHAENRHLTEQNDDLRRLNRALVAALREIVKLTKDQCPLDRATNPVTDVAKRALAQVKS